MIVIIAAVAVSSTMQVSQQIELAKGQSATVGGYQLTFAGHEMINEPHRQAIASRVAISRDGKDLGSLTPRMNYYEMSREPIGSPDVLSGPKQDLYLSVLNADTENQTVALQVYINPMIGWIWICTGLMALGSIIVIIPTRSRRETVTGDEARVLSPSESLKATLALGQEK
jgi:cytochrome c-type biogenesis protein CcmF